ncbi:TPA: hypothetical protein ACHAC8_001628, partial [Enterococcus faecium]
IRCPLSSPPEYSLSVQLLSLFSYRRKFLINVEVSNILDYFKSIKKPAIFISQAFFSIKYI